MSMQNSLIHDTMPDQTLHNVSSVVSYLQSIEPVDDCELGEKGQHGLYLGLSCVQEALEYEAGRVEKLRKAATDA